MNNILFILIDGGRYDHIVSHPVYKELFKDAMWYHRVYAAAPYTIGAMHSMFTGMYPKNNGVNGYFKPSKLKETAKIIPQYLKEQGYYTLCDITSKIVMADRGFDSYQLHDEYTDNVREKQTGIIRNNADMLKENAPFFIYFHYPKIHTDLVNSVLKKYDDFSEEYFSKRDENERNYMESLDDTAEYLRDIMNTLEETSLISNTDVWILSDHGVSLGERYGERAYGVFLNDYTLHTFVLNYRAGRTGGNDYDIRSSIDILPLIFNNNSLSVPSGIDGRIDRKIIKKGVFKKIHDMAPLYCETGGVNGPYPSPEEHNVFGVIRNNEKLVHFKGIDKYEQYRVDMEHEEKTEKISHDLKKLLSEYESI